MSYIKSLVTDSFSSVFKWPKPAIGINSRSEKSITEVIERHANANANANPKLFRGHHAIVSLFYLYLFKKYRSECLLLPGGGLTTGVLGLYLMRHEPEHKNTYTRLIVSQLVSCILKKNGRPNTIIIPVYLKLYYGAHANVLIYRDIGDNKPTIEHFEPHGRIFIRREYYTNSRDEEELIDDPFNEADQIWIDDELSYFIKLLNDGLVEAKLTPVTFIPSHEICPKLDGFQNMESAFENNNILQKGGFCAAWSMFFTELALANPKMTGKQIVSFVLNKENIKSEDGGKYLKQIIEGYSTRISDKLDKYYSIVFKDTMSSEAIIQRVESNDPLITEKLEQILSIEFDMMLKQETISTKIIERKKYLKKIKTTPEEKTKLEEELQIMILLESLDYDKSQIGKSSRKIRTIFKNKKGGKKISRNRTRNKKTLLLGRAKRAYK